MVRVLCNIDGASPTQCLEHTRSLLGPDTTLRSRDRDPKQRADKERSSSRQRSVTMVETPSNRVGTKQNLTHQLHTLGFLATDTELIAAHRRADWLRDHERAH
jgi:hypothetical protein